jgi:CBS domain-containing protein
MQEHGMRSLTVSDFLAALPHRVDLATVVRDSPLQEVVKTMVTGHRRRVIYVVDADGRLEGAIPLDALKDRIFRYYLDAQVGNALVVTERLLEIFASETAEEIMETGLTTCRLHESLQDAISRLIEGNLKDLPVVDQDGRLIADLDILCFLELWLLQGEAFFP